MDIFIYRLKCGTWRLLPISLQNNVTHINAQAPSWTWNFKKNIVFTCFVHFYRAVCRLSQSFGLCACWIESPPDSDGLTRRGGVALNIYCIRLAATQIKPCYICSRPSTLSLPVLWVTGGENRYCFGSTAIYTHNHWDLFLGPGSAVT